MKRWQRMILTAVLPAMIPMAAWPSDSTESFTLDGVAAYVNQRAVTRGDVSAVVAPVASRLYAQYRGRELEDRMNDALRMALRNLIDRALILDAYERGAMKIPEQVIESRIREIKFNHFRDDRNGMYRDLAQAGLSLASWREQLREDIIVSLMRDMHVSGRITISPSELRQAYKESLDNYVVPDQAWLRVIMIRGGERDDTTRHDLAVSLVARLRDGARFEDLASTYSEGRRADDGGDWGWVNLQELRSELADPARELPVATVSDVITVNDDHYIIQVMDRRAGRVKPIAEVYDELDAELRQRKAERLYTRWIAHLESNAAVYEKEDVF